MRQGKANASLSAKPFVLVESGPHGLLVTHANDAAKALGAKPSLRFTDAKARVPQLISEEIDRQADHKALTALALWLIRIAPLSSIEDEETILLDVSGCTRLYGSEDQLLDQLTDLLSKNGFPHQAAIASTPGAAIALCRHRKRLILPYKEEAKGLEGLPICALRLSDEARTLLRRFGLTRIDQLYGIDRKALARRFRSAKLSDAVLLRLDQALGRRGEPLIPLRPPPQYAARLPCPEALISPEGVVSGLDLLIGRLCQSLQAAGQGARQFDFCAFRADGTLAEVSIATSRPTRDPDHLRRLFRERTDRIDPGFGIDLLLLSAARAGAMDQGIRRFAGTLTGAEQDAHGAACFADKISSKLGQDAVKVHQYNALRSPSLAETKASFAGAFPLAPPPDPQLGPRPLRLFEHPEPVTAIAEVPDGPPRIFRWRRVQRRVVKSDGPERIAPRWGAATKQPSTMFRPKIDQKWLSPKLDPRADAGQIAKVRQQLEKSLQEAEGKLLSTAPRTRDYYRVEDEQGRRYWLYRDGLYHDEHPDDPLWYVHGVFG